MLGPVQLATAVFEPPAAALKTARAAAGRTDAEKKKALREAAAGGAKPKGKGPKPVKQAQQKKDDGASPAPAAAPAPSPVSTRRAQLGSGHKEACWGVMLQIVREKGLKDRV